MRTAVVALTLAVGLVLLTGCFRRAGPPVPATAPVATGKTSSTIASDSAYPELRAQSGQELDYGSGTKGRIWSLTGQKLKTLIVKLIVARDGKKEPGTEMTCTWDEPSKNIEAQLVLLLQDGSAFGAKGKRLPALTLAFRSGAPDVRKSQSAVVVHETLPPRSSTAATDSTVGGQDILFHEISSDSAVGETISIGGTEDSLIEASKNKRLVIGVLVEWKR